MADQEILQVILGGGGGGFYENGTAGNRNNAGGNAFVSGGAKITGDNGCIAGFGGGGMSWSHGAGGGGGGRRSAVADILVVQEVRIMVMDMEEVVEVIGLVMVVLLKVVGKHLQLQMAHLKLGI